MGALAPYNSSWIPADDLLLKNAVEAGASLEALAKGAISFSRRFTIQELQDRWRSLLYDPVTSSNASCRMVDLEYSASFVSPQSKRLGNCKGNGVRGKRKGERVRSQYYAMRKRICSEPFNSDDLRFFVAPNLHNCTSNGVGFQEQLTIDDHHMAGNCTLGDPIANHFELPDADFDMVHDGFSHLHTGPEDNISDGLLEGDCLYGFAENVSHVLVNKAVNSDRGHSFEHDDMHQSIISHVLEESLPDFVNNSAIREMGPPQALPVNNIFEKDALKTYPFADFDSINHDPGFEANQGFNSPISDCSAQFHQLGYPSPLPVMPIWGTIEENSAPAIPIDEKPLHHLHSSIVQRDDYKKMSVSGYEIIHPNPQMKIWSIFQVPSFSRMLTDDIPSKTESPKSCLTTPVVACSGELDDTGDKLHSDMKVCDLNLPVKTSASLPNSPELVNGVICCVLNTEDPDVPCNNNFPKNRSDSEQEKNVLNEKDFRPCIYLDDPSKGHQVPEKDYAVVALRNVSNGGEPSLCRSVSLTAYSDRRQKENSTECGKEHEFDNNDYHPGRILDDCKMAPHVPSQNHVLVPETGSSEVDLSERVLNPSISDQDEEDYENENGDDVPYFSDIEALILDMDLDPFDEDSCFNSEVSRYQHEDTKRTIIRLEQGAHSYMQRAIASHSSFAVLYGRHLKHYIKKTEGTYFGTGRQIVSTSHVEHVSTLGNLSLGLKKCMACRAHILARGDKLVATFETKALKVNRFKTGISKKIQDERTMVNVYSIASIAEAVEMAKRAETKLKLAPYSSFTSLATAMASTTITLKTTGMTNSAICYNCGKMGYMRRECPNPRKPHDTFVLLGRATDDFSVDIDLGREGRANKISRRQAILKMEEDGSFWLKNLGKFAILVSSTEVATGQRVRLSSSCLIEIKGMRFLFETNQKAVKQYLATNAKKRKGNKNANFDWTPEGVL
ncbi:hypothetical protein GIB67_029171 [Kingdonia uniflora]|uniref:FHA domain-containing protein n=1 Tax=Kingdonia uniflora TaxID=39325 RepID=A0A7J7LS78_9MAGN|nr:hypothetical protein GIB67_029171 [Kingdonia uniflora]